MSSSDRPDREALNELEDVLEHIAESLSSWRARALQAEARLGREGGLDGPAGDPEALNRIDELQVENRDLADRVDTARARIEILLKRLQFLEEQVGSEAGNR